MIHRPRPSQICVKCHLKSRITAKPRRTIFVKSALYSTRRNRRHSSQCRIICRLCQKALFQTTGFRQICYMTHNTIQIGFSHASRPLHKWRIVSSRTLKWKARITVSSQASTGLRHIIVLWGNRQSVSTQPTTKSEWTRPPMY